MVKTGALEKNIETLTKKIHVVIKSEAWIKEANSYMNIDSQFKTFFPNDCFIARGTGRENEHLLPERGIDLEYQGAGESVRCFLELRTGGQFRPSNRGSIRAFYRAIKAKVGDVIVIDQVSPRKFKFSLAANTSTLPSPAK